MSRKPRVAVLGSYAPDGQVSMLRFERMLVQGLEAAGVVVRRVCPVGRVVRGKRAGGGLGKWLGYVDKYLLFPWSLARELGRWRPDVVHITDHSNSVYLRRLKRWRVVVTCHDLLAVRAALGEFAGIRVGRLGRTLQAGIVAGLRDAAWVACVSEATLGDLRRVVGGVGLESRSSVIPLGVDPVFGAGREVEARARVERILAERGLAPLAEDPLVLHVGSDVWYKNRDGVLETFARLNRRAGGKIRFLVAGGGLSERHQSMVRAAGLSERCDAIVGLSDEDLRAVYCSAKVMFFPSLAEGFGWPIAEAQACGCPVVISNRAPLTEVADSMAMRVDPVDVEQGVAAIEHVLALDPRGRRGMVESGLTHASRFRVEVMGRAYSELYGQVAGRGGT